MIVFDTSVLSLVLRRQGPGGPETRELAVLRRILDVNVETAVPGIVLQEILSGVRGASQFRELRRALDDFRLLLATRDHHLAAAEISNACRARGIVASLADCLIAAVTIAERGRLFTTDRDFTHIAEHSALQLLDVGQIAP